MNRFTLSYWKCTSSEHAYMSCVQEQCKNWYLCSSIEYILDDVIRRSRMYNCFYNSFSYIVCVVRDMSTSIKCVLQVCIVCTESNK